MQSELKFKFFTTTCDIIMEIYTQLQILSIWVVSNYIYCVTTATKGKYPFWNVNLSWNERIDDLVSRLTIKELVYQTMEITNDASPNGVSRLGIKPYYWVQECLRGADRVNSTAFPQAIGLSASWSTALLHNVSEVVSVELRGHWNSLQDMKAYNEAFSGLSCYSPVVNIARHPLWGRNQETYGECPHLTGELAQSYVQGLQGSHPRYVRATSGCKHFDAHGGPEDIPSNRFSFDATVSDRDLRMTFLPAFKKCVEAGTYGIMCSYNSINGVPSCASKKLLTDILRTEWNFQGVVVSDSGAIRNIFSEHHYTKTAVNATVLAIKAGCNANLPLGQHVDIPNVPYYLALDAYKQGLLTEEELRNNVKPMFRTRMILGEFDPKEMNPYRDKSLNASLLQSFSHRQLAHKAAQMSFTLLKNHLYANQPALPLQGPVSTLALVGPFVNNTIDLFGDYSPDITVKYTSTVLQGLKNLATNDLSVASGCNNALCQVYDSEAVKSSVKGAGLVIVALGTGIKVEIEGHDRASLDLPGKQLDLLQDAVNYAKGSKVILLLFNAGPLDITWAKLTDNVHAILECYFPAQATGKALYNTLLGRDIDSVPAGRLTITWPAYIAQVGQMTNYSMVKHTYRYYTGNPLYSFGYGLSYTQFHYSGLQVTPTEITAGENVSVKVFVSNVGKYSADEVIQVYLSWPTKYQFTHAPKIQLVGFKRETIVINEGKSVYFVITPEQMSVWIDDKDRWKILPGEMTVYVGGQQPHQTTQVPSNVLQQTFFVQ